MFYDVTPLRDSPLSELPIVNRALHQFVRGIERLFNGLFVTNARALPYSRTDIAELMLLAGRLRAAETVLRCRPAQQLPDEPRLFGWSANYGTDQGAGGFSARSDTAALAAAIAEGLERSIWYRETDYYRSPITARASELRSSVAPESFAGYTEEQRLRYPRFKLPKDDSYLWISGYSWTRKEKTYVPAQIVSRTHAVEAFKNKAERHIRSAITTGLATAPTRDEALLRGALEVIERDAYMIMWKNQLSLPRLDPREVCGNNPHLTQLLAACTRYRLSVTFITLITDAPAHVICAVVDDPTESPARVIGLAANGDISRAAEKALIEALRGRLNIRNRLPRHLEFTDKDWRTLVHWERSIYWATKRRWEALSFLTQGEEKSLPERPWENLTPREHFNAIVEWCRNSGYELASVALTPSRKNLSPWHIEMVMIPELQPMHLDERRPAFGGARFTEIPLRFGYTTRENAPEAPHPFI